MNSGKDGFEEERQVRIFRCNEYFQPKLGNNSALVAQLDRAAAF